MTQLVQTVARPVQRRATPQQSGLRDKSFDILRDSSRTAVWGLHQLSFLAPRSGPCNIQHISYMANIFWAVSEPVKILLFPGPEAGLCPGLFENLWKNVRVGKWGGGRFFSFLFFNIE